MCLLTTYTLLQGVCCLLVIMTILSMSGTLWNVPGSHYCMAMKTGCHVYRCHQMGLHFLQEAGIIHYG